MKKFLKKSIYFSIPLIIILGPCLYLLYSSGELYSNGTIIRPLKEQQLIGLAYTEINEYYKFEMCDKVFCPDIIALGSSRIMQVKKNIVSDNYTFYNAGGAVNNIYQFKHFLDNLHIKPKMFIINIDQWFFNPNFVNQKRSFNIACYKAPKMNLFGKCANLIIDITLGKIDFEKVFNRQNSDIGINAKINRNGFTYDGSYYYGGIVKSPSEATDYNFANTFERIKEGKNRFQYCDMVDRTVVEAIDKFLYDCEKSRISVVAILPPFAPMINEKLNQSHKYAYMNQIYGLLSPVFDKYDKCYLYDFTDMRSLGVHNYDFIDGFHGSDLIYNLIVKYIISKNKDISYYFVEPSSIDDINNQYIKRNIRYHKYN